MKTHTKTLIATLTAAVGLAAGGAQAAVIADYKFDDLTSSDTSTVSASSITLGSILTASADTSTGGSTGNPDGRLEFKPVILDTTVFDDGTAKSLVFTLTPQAGDSLNMTSISFDIFQTSGGTRTSVNVYSTLADGTINDATADKIGSTIASATNNVFVTRSFDLSGFTNVTSPVTFQVEFVSGAGSGTIRNRVDNIVVNADIVPEPGSLALLGLGGLLIARRRRG